MSTSLSAEEISTTTADGVTLYGEAYFADLDSVTPLVLLFHQAGGDGRGEYSEIAAWLNTLGVRAIAWDQRSGGDRFGGINRTEAELPAGTSTEYCDVTPDLQAALDYVKEKHLADVVIAWGSSYSASLVFELAANNPNTVSGIVAMSPASGGPMVTCRARQWLEDISVPILVMRPEAEMAREPSQQQRDLLVEGGADFYVVSNGVHGSSMLVDTRTKQDMSEARKLVGEWLKQF
jgi:alpha-beta hydrolase superfamily lysophospholipase